MKIEDLVDEVFVINLDKSTDRLDSFKKQALKNNIEFTRITPVDSSKFSVKPTRNNGWNNNAKSLQETTKEIIKLSKKKGHKNILIFEDDAKINSDLFSQFLSDCKNFMKRIGRYDFIHIYHSNSFNLSLDSYCNFRLTKDGCLGCVSYMINRSVFDIYLEELNKLEIPIDHVTKRIHRYRKRSFLYELGAVTHSPNEYSTLRGRIVDY
jgi:GR25 family glycosyltransferase involved in LPS biosynthesis